MISTWDWARRSLSRQTTTKVRIGCRGRYWTRRATISLSIWSRPPGDCGDPSTPTRQRIPFVAGPTWKAERGVDLTHSPWRLVNGRYLRIEALRGNDKMAGLTLFQGAAFQFGHCGFRP